MKNLEHNFDGIRVVVSPIVGCHSNGTFYDGLVIDICNKEKMKMYFGYGKKPDEWTIYDPFMMKDENVSLGQYINTRIAGCKRHFSPGKLNVSCNVKGGKLIIKAQYSVRHVQIGYDLCGQESFYRDSLELEIDLLKN